MTFPWRATEIDYLRQFGARDGLARAAQILGRSEAEVAALWTILVLPSPAGVRCRPETEALLQDGCAWALRRVEALRAEGHIRPRAPKRKHLRRVLVTMAKREGVISQ